MCGLVNGLKGLLRKLLFHKISPILILLRKNDGLGSFL